MLSLHDDLELSNDFGVLRRISAPQCRHIRSSLSASHVDYESTSCRLVFELKSQHALALRCPTPSIHDDLELSNDLGVLCRLSAPQSS